ncbi:gas vesicle protein [Oryzihumus sp.]|uniref:gas vesicle protein n=1 Tax=Oryzihumus sp. TaxID=1968903 RepID=UPI002ED7E9A4
MTTTLARSEPSTPVLGNVTLVDLLDRLIGTGVVLAGEVTISMAGVDLVRVSLRALVATASAALEEAVHD